jgi:hypothetical protein
VHAFVTILFVWQEEKEKRGYKTEAEREREAQEAAAQLDYRFITVSSVNSASSSGDQSLGKESITEYMKTVKAKGRQEEIDNFLDNSDEALALQQAEKSKGVGDFEEVMKSQDEIAVQTRWYHWQDKYRPRKPRYRQTGRQTDVHTLINTSTYHSLCAWLSRYFNRVKTGYDWNKYNSTHYDHDNPPPKTVQVRSC